MKDFGASSHLRGEPIDSTSGIPPHHKCDRLITYVMDWAELKDRFMQWANTGKNPPRSGGTRALSSELSKWKGYNSWVGCSKDEMVGWMKSGYQSPAFLGAGYVERSMRRRISWKDEGELDIAMALSGWDFPYREWELRPKRPGLRIVADMAWGCGTDAKAIAEYGAWVAANIGALEAAGYDLEVDVMYPAYTLFEDEPTGLRLAESGPRTNTIVRVKKANEASDFTEWSALFSPGSFRMIGFFFWSMIADREKRPLTTHMGYPADNGYSVDWRPDDRTVWLWTPNGGSNPPLEMLTEQMKATGLIAELDY